MAALFAPSRQAESRSILGSRRLFMGKCSRANPSVTVGRPPTITYSCASTIEGKALAAPPICTRSPCGTTIGSARPPPKMPAGTFPTTVPTGCRYDYNGVPEFRLCMVLAALGRVVERPLRSKSWHRHLLHPLSHPIPTPQSVPVENSPRTAKIRSGDQSSVCDLSGRVH